MGPDTTMFRVEGARLLQVFSAYLGIDTTTGSCPAAMSARASDLLVASRRQASRAASIAALSAGVPRWSLNVPHGIANARVLNWKRPPPAPSVPRPRCCTRSLRGTQSPPAARAARRGPEGDVAEHLDHVRRTQMPLEHLAAGQRATESWYPLVPLRDVVDGCSECVAIRPVR